MTHDEFIEFVTTMDHPLDEQLSEQEIDRFRANVINEFFRPSPLMERIAEGRKS